jgi:hypothetical protein
MPGPTEYEYFKYVLLTEVPHVLTTFSTPQLEKLVEIKRKRGEVLPSDIVAEVRRRGLDHLLNPEEASRNT